jgi:hypothetical protein
MRRRRRPILATPVRFCSLIVAGTPSRVIQVPNDPWGAAAGRGFVRRLLALAEVAVARHAGAIGLQWARPRYHRPARCSRTSAVAVCNGEQTVSRDDATIPLPGR